MSALATWPAQGDYRDALQNIDLAFRDPDLRMCNVERNRTGLPRARSGAFATVYKLTRANGQAIALKLFNFPSEDRQRRYTLVSDHLRSLGNRRPACLVDFSYQLEGIRVKGKMYPAQTMAWVTGQTLGQWLRDRMLAKQIQAVRKLADDWVQMIQQLQDAKIAHGDLQHDNIMVAQDRLLLVDYDGMCVPGLEGAPQLEHGKPAYQHPQRPQHPLSLEIDNFASWVILVALRACAADPALYLRFVEKAENDNILFCEKDLADPDRSSLWPELLHSPDADVRAWSKELRTMLLGDYTAVSRLNLNPLARLVELAGQSPLPWDELHAEAARLVAAGKTLPSQPPQLAKLVAEARQRVAARDKLRAALMAKDFKTIATIYAPDLFAGWPNQAGLARQAARAKEQYLLLQKLVEASKVADGGRSLVKTWHHVKDQLNNVPDAEPYRLQAASWQDKLAAMTDLQDAISKNDDAQIAAAWSRCQAVGPHPEIRPDMANRARQSALRIDLLSKLQSLRLDNSEASDRALVAAWNPTLATLREAQPFRAALDRAQHNLQTLAALSQAMAEADRGNHQEAAITRLSAALPLGYQHSLQERVQKFLLGQSQFRDLNAALDRAPASDTAIAEAWERLQSQHATLAGRLDLERRKRCELAVRRRDTIKAIRAAVQSSADEYQKDIKLYNLERKHKDDLKHASELAALLPRLELARRRLKAWEHLKAALAGKEIAKIARYAESIDLKGYPPLATVADQIAAAATLGRWMVDLSDRLKAAAKLSHIPLSREDLDKMAQHKDFFTDQFRSSVAAMVASRISQVSQLAVSQDYQILPGSIPAVKVFWSWSGHGLISRFKLAAVPGKVCLRAEDAPPEASSTCRPEDHGRDGGGRSILLNSHEPMYISIWPVVELGWDTVYGAPLTIGPVEAGGRR